MVRCGGGACDGPCRAPRGEIVRGEPHPKLSWEAHLWSGLEKMITEGDCCDLQKGEILAQPWSISGLHIVACAENRGV